MRTELPRNALEGLASALAAAGACVLRNPFLFENLARGGDWDILVPSLEDAESLLIRHLGPPDGMARRSYVSSYLYGWGYIDLFSDWQWRGVQLLDNAHLRQGLTPGPDGIPKLAPATEAIVCWFTKLLWNGSGDPRYRESIIEAARTDPREFENACSLLVGRRLGSEVSALAAASRPEEADVLVSKLRRAVSRQAYRRRPVSTVKGRSAFLLAEIRLRLNPPVPMIESHALAENLCDIETTAAGAWAAVSGVVVVRVPDRRSKGGGSIPFAFGYWTTLVNHRVRGRIVVLAVQPTSSARLLRAGRRRWLTPKSDLIVGHDGSLPDDLSDWLLGETRRRALRSLLPGTSSAVKGWESP